MTNHRRALVALLAAASLSMPAGARLPRPEPPGGAVPASSSNVELVGGVQLTDVPGGIADVAALGEHAYVAAWAGECFAPSAGNPQSQGPGVHVVDFSIPQMPRKVAFIPAPTNAFVGEGVAVQHIRTRSFNGDLLLVSHEPCDSGERGAGGISLYDVTNPAAPAALTLGAGDRSPKPKGGRSAHPSHSAFLWQQGARAYVVAVDNEESSFRDVDIFDVSNPRKPKLIAETGMPFWRGLNGRARNQKAFGSSGAGSFHHDVWVRKVGRDWLMLVSYWDSGWVVLNVNNPRKPRYLRDSNYPAFDKLTKKPTEGNAHQAVFSADGRYIIGTNEDLFAKFTVVVGGRTDTEWFEFSQELPRARPMRTGLGGVVGGPTIYGGFGCPPLGIPSPSTLGELTPGDTAIVVLQEGGTCDVSAKMNAAAALGYRMAVLVSSHETSQFGIAPTAVSCNRPSNAVNLSAVCISHARFHAMFDANQFASNGASQLHYVDPVIGEPRVGARGDYMRAITFSDGTWGDVNLVNARTMKLIDQHQVREGLDRNCLEGCGALSVHEVKHDPRARTNIVYASWYGAGMRVLTYGATGLREVGHYTDGAQDYWGVMPVAQADGPPLVLMSDMNYGLTILRYTG